MSRNKSKQQKSISEIIRDIQKQFSKYSVHDIASTLFVSSLWIPNISSSIQHQLLYAAFISMKPDRFSKVDKVEKYGQFRALLHKIFPLLPPFPHLEDFVPELDWGDVKFYYEGKSYKIFYGGDVESIYDFLYSFQILYATLDGTFQEVTHRSPSSELKCCLEFQDTIISSIKINKQELDLENISPGHLEIPTDRFWLQATGYYNAFDSIDFLPLNILEDYSIMLGSEVFAELLRDNEFHELIATGKLLSFYFVKHDDKHYALFPRKFSEVLLQTWGNLFAQHGQQLINRIDFQDHLNVEILKYLGERYHKKHIFPFSSPVSKDGRPEEPVFSCAFLARNRLVLVYAAQPIWEGEDTQKYLDELAPKLEIANQLLKDSPTTLALVANSENVVFTSEQDKTLHPEIITVLPSTSIEFAAFAMPEQMPGRIVFLHDFLALFDELNDFDELDGLYEFLTETEPKLHMPLYSLLDKYGAFRDSDGTLMQGATEYDLISIDPHWGSNKRYETLMQFWKQFPIINIDLLGHPRSWTAETIGDHRLSLVARNYVGRTLICEVGKTVVLINSPLDRLSYEQGRMADMMTEIMEDSIYLNSKALAAHSFFQTYRVLLISVFPADLVRNDNELSHLLHLLPQDDMWNMDGGTPQLGAKGIRIVFGEKSLTEYLLNTTDRTLEAQLLKGLLLQANGFIHSPNFQVLVKKIEDYQNGQPRFKLTQFAKAASFPELISPRKPTERHHKAAGKRVAQVALSANLLPGNFALEEAKTYLNTLRSALVKEIDQIVQQYSYPDTVPYLISKIDALIDEYTQESRSLEASLEHEVEYDRAERGAKSQIDFFAIYKVYRHLLEKYVQLTPTGNKYLEEPDFQYLVALIQKLHRIYEASDSINYQIYPVGLTVDEHFVVTVNYSDDLEGMQSTYQKELYEIDLGLAGMLSDRVESPTPVEDFLKTIDSSFKTNLEFRFRNMVNVLQVLSMWTSFYVEEPEDKTYYFASSAQIAEVCNNTIEGFDVGEIDAILAFLTLKSEQMLVVYGQQELCEDLPVWEYYKRPGRYNIRPLIELNGKIYWGAHSARRAGMAWISALQSGKLPFDIQSPAIKSAIDDEKTKVEKALVEKAALVVREFTSLVEIEVLLHRRDRQGNHPMDLGDFDVLAYVPKKNILLNIECKDILPAFCLKDDSRIRRKFFGTGGGDKGFLGKVEKREEYLTANIHSIMEVFGWKPSTTDNPKVVSLFLSRRSYWWTRFPPVTTQINFLRIDMLREYLARNAS